jgi:hypothetical protein
MVEVRERGVGQERICDRSWVEVSFLSVFCVAKIETTQNLQNKVDCFKNLRYFHRKALLVSS